MLYQSALIGTREVRIVETKSKILFIVRFCVFKKFNNQCNPRSCGSITRLVGVGSWERSESTRIVDAYLLRGISRSTKQPDTVLLLYYMIGNDGNPSHYHYIPRRSIQPQTRGGLYLKKVVLL